MGTKKQTQQQSKTTNQSKEQSKNKKSKADEKLKIKMIKNFNKECLRENKAIEINAQTEKFILYGLSQKDNVLTRYEDNYEKIANMLCSVLLNRKNVKQKEKK